MSSRATRGIRVLACGRGTGSAGEDDKIVGRERGRNLVFAILTYFFAAPACFSNIPATKNASAATSHCIRQD
jgi:hypothetical protein